MAQGLAGYISIRPSLKEKWNRDVIRGKGERSKYGEVLAAQGGEKEKYPVEHGEAERARERDFILL